MRLSTHPLISHRAKLLTLPLASAAVVTALAIGAGSATRLEARPRPETLVDFEVASVKPAVSNETRPPGLQILPGGRLLITNLPL
jgi:hypothetical protein